MTVVSLHRARIEEVARAIGRRLRSPLSSVRRLATLDRKHAMDTPTRALWCTPLLPDRVDRPHLSAATGDDRSSTQQRAAVRVRTCHIADRKEFHPCRHICHPASTWRRFPPVRSRSRASAPPSPPSSDSPRRARQRTDARHQLDPVHADLRRLRRGLVPRARRVRLLPERRRRGVRRAHRRRRRRQPVARRRAELPSCRPASDEAGSSSRALEARSRRRRDHRRGRRRVASRRDDTFKLIVQARRQGRARPSTTSPPSAARTTSSPGAGRVEADRGRGDQGRRRWRSAQRRRVDARRWRRARARDSVSTPTTTSATRPTAPASPASRPSTKSRCSACPT